MFSENYKIIKTHNLKAEVEGLPFEMGINRFTDMTDREFEEQVIQGGILIKRRMGEIRPFTVEEVEREEAYYQNMHLHRNL